MTCMHSNTRLAALCLAGATLAAHGQAPSTDPGARNVYMAGGEVRPAQPIGGDLAAAGGRVVLEQPVGGDAALAGGSVEVRASVGDDLRIAGGSVSVDSRVGGQLLAVGADVTLRPGAAVSGSADLSAANVLVQGRIGAALRGRAQKIVVDGEVDGPVHLAAERVELGAGARLKGPLTYESPNDLVRAEAAVVQGPVVREMREGGRARRPGPPSRAAGPGGPGVLIAYVALLACCSALLLLMPALTSGAAARLRASPWRSLGIGAASLFALPLAMLLLFITILGIPLGLALAAAYPVLLLGGFIVGVLGLTDAMAARLRRRHDPDTVDPAHRPGLGQVALGLLGVVALGLVPVAGALLVLLLALAGLGAAILQLRARRSAGVETAVPGDRPLPRRDVFPA